MIAGMDEAGRGPAIGPMFIAVCAVHDEERLIAMGVADSKSFGSSPAARAARGELYMRIREVCEVRVAQIMPWVIDEWVEKGPGLNELERWAGRNLIRSLGNDLRLFADGERIFGALASEFGGTASDRGDARYPVVSAASIVAKHLRDEWFARYAAIMSTKLGIEVRGGGYPNRATEAFVRTHLERYGVLPPMVRRSWKSIREISAGTLRLF